MKSWVQIIVRFSSIALVYKVCQSLIEQTSIAITIGQTLILAIERVWV